MAIKIVVISYKKKPDTKMSSDFTDLLEDKLADFKNKAISNRTFYDTDRKNNESFRKKCDKIRP
ncbi:hypothetical protein [Rodentibacter pneumotropicus]|uniref:Uncharacterized protein n=1 Tax=Rodentibacter pneumotropicus TaxID=758 RepID=A0A4S2Q039_9PAST|nr:hypothetical protein [Rodentibacter pneumotropicus]THA09783.1 hypothetical protein D3M78_04725 [Rodentibacter pneumotropicus]